VMRRINPAWVIAGSGWRSCHRILMQSWQR
jgi:hypothetical protein